MLKKLFLIIFVLGTFSISFAQEIEIRGNDIVVETDGSNSPNLVDGTEYEPTPVSATRIHEFTIENIGASTVQFLSIWSTSNEFRINSRIRRIRAGQSAILELAFEPTAIETIEGTIFLFALSGGSFRLFAFNVEGHVSETSRDAEIMISQYYEKDDNDRIEIKNMTDYTILRNDYFLVKFDSGDDLSQNPQGSNIVRIGELAPGEVVVYDDFDLNGDEVIVVSSSRRRNCFDDRIDIIGIQGTSWGKDVSYSKGGCATETLHVDFDISHWIALTNDEVDTAQSNQNIYLGAYQTGSITWEANQWTDGALPDRTRVVLINDGYSGALGGIEACDLIVNDHLDFNNESTASVVVYRDLDINDTFEIGDTESLVMYDDDAIIEGEITKIEKSTLLTNAFDFTFWSSPVKDASVENVFSGVRRGRTYYFDQSKTTASDPDNDPEGTFWNVWVQAQGELIPGKGYASEANQDYIDFHEITFQGAPNNGVVYESVHYNDDENDFNDTNLIGNPYPSAIDIELFFDENEDVIDPTIYLWTHATPASEETGDYTPNDFATYNRMGGTGVGSGPKPSKNIGSGQGFQVRSIKTDKIVFKNKMRIKNANDQFFKSIKKSKTNRNDERDRIWLDITTNQGGFNQILIGFDPQASSGFDAGFDAIKNQSSNKISFYTILDEKKLAIQGLGNFDESTEIQMGFDTKLTNREYLISISSVSGILRDTDIVLKDHALNISHNLKESNYKFEHLSEGSYPDRFSLTFSKPIEITDQEIEHIDGFEVFNESDTFFIKASKKIETVHFYDILGRSIVVKHPRSSSYEMHESSIRNGELVFVQVKYSDQSEQIKKIYKH